MQDCFQAIPDIVNVDGGSNQEQSTSKLTLTYLDNSRFLSMAFAKAMELALKVKATR